MTQDDDTITIVSYVDAKHTFKLDYWTSLIEVTRGNVIMMAELSGVSRTNLYARLDKLNLRGLLRQHSRRKPHKGNAEWRELGA